MNPAIQAQKKLLREQIAKVLSLMTTDSRVKQSADIFEKLKLIGAYQESKRISIYLSTEMEVDTVPILKHIFETNRKCYIPRYNGNVMQMVGLASMEDYDNLPMNKWSIKQPKLKEEREDALATGGLDLIIIPGVAFTKGGKRCGHGKGYYDSFLHTIFAQQTKRPTTIAVTFLEQIKDDIPVHEYDVSIDYVLSAD